MTKEERIASLHVMMTAIRHKQERRKAALLGTCCTGLAVCLALLIVHQAREDVGLFGSTGGCILIAAVAFMLGVMITVAIRWRQEKKRPEGQNGNARMEPHDNGLLPDDALVMAAGGKKDQMDNATREEHEGNSRRGKE